MRDSSQLIDITDSPYCQIADKRITAKQCRDMQGQEGCFGCAASTRLCESCKKEAAAVAAVGLGNNCLAKQLAEERKIGKPTFPSGTQTSCQMAHKSIGVAMCLATQGQEGCRGCPAPSRLCEKCKKRPSRFRQYGLCLSCSVKEFEENPEPAGDDNDELAEEPTHKAVPKAAISIPKNELVTKNLPKARKMVIIAEKASAFFLARQLDISYPVARIIISCLEEEGVIGPAQGTKPRKVLLHGKDLILKRKKAVFELTDTTCLQCRKRPVWVKKWSLCTRCANTFYKRERQRGESYQKRQRAGKEKHGGDAHCKRREVMVGLSEEVSRTMQPRATYVKATRKHKKLCTKCAKWPIWIKKRGLCKRCAGAFYSRQKLLGQKQEVRKRAINPLTKNIAVRLEKLIRVFGADSEVGKLLQDVVVELRRQKRWERAQAELKRILLA